MMRDFWVRADQDRSGSISVPELAMLPFPGHGPYAGKQIGAMAAQILIQTFDRTGRGELDWDTFCQIFTWLEMTQMHFYNADKDRGGTLDISEVPAALYACGYSLPPAELQVYVTRHATAGHLNFLQYMSLVCELQRTRPLYGAPLPYHAGAAHGAVGAHGVAAGAHGAGAHGSKGGKKGKDKGGKKGKDKGGKKGKDKKKGKGSKWDSAGDAVDVVGAVADCASS